MWTRSSTRLTSSAWVVSIVASGSRFLAETVVAASGVGVVVWKENVTRDY